MTIARWARRCAAVYLLAGLCGWTGCSWLQNTPDPVAPVGIDELRTHDVKLHGWDAIEQTNGLVTLRHVPEAGGRTFSLEIGGDDAFLIFPAERGKTYPAGSRDTSVHFGGHYVCIGPETVWNVHNQPFNGHGGPYKATRELRDDSHTLHLVSEPGTWKGATVSLERTITLHRGTTHVIIDEEVTNLGPEPLPFYIWDFTQIDATDYRKPGKPLRDMTFYVPVPRKAGAKDYTVFFEREPKMMAQFDEMLDASVLAIHYKAEQFKIAAHPSDWWVAVVDHDTGWTYIKAFDVDHYARYVDGNGPVEVYGSFMNEPMGQPFVEMELLGGMKRCPRRGSIKQREHWYATICKGPILEVTPVGAVCERMDAESDGGFLDVSGRFGVFHLGSVRLRIVNHQNESLYLDEPIAIDPRKEFVLEAALPLPEEHAAGVVLEVLDHNGNLVGELDRVAAR